MFCTLWAFVHKCSQGGKGVLVKAVTVMEVGPKIVFEVIMSLDRHQRYEYADAKQFIFAYYRYL